MTSLQTLKNWAKENRMTIQTLFLSLIAVIISFELYRSGQGLLETPRDLYSWSNPLMPFFVYSLALIFLLVTTYLFLQIKTQTIDIRDHMDGEKSSFIRMAADAVRTPLTGLRWITELFLGGDLGEMNTAQRDSILKMNRAIEHLIGQINEILKVIKLSGGLIHYNPRMQNVSELLIGAMEDVQTLAEAREQKLVFLQREADFSISVDPPLIRHVLNVLLNKAIESANRRAEITLHAVRGTDNVTIAVGYPATGEEKFTEEDSTNFVNNVGVNLSVSREILSAAGGQLVMDLSNNVCSMRITLPQENHASPTL